MLLTVKMLKKALEDAPEDALVGSMNFGADYKLELYSPKRFLVGQTKKEGQLFIINNMGTHWNEKWEEGFNGIKILKTIDRDNGKS